MIIEGFAAGGPRNARGAHLYVMLLCNGGKWFEMTTLGQMCFCISFHILRPTGLLVFGAECHIVADSDIVHRFGVSCRIRRWY